MLARPWSSLHDDTNTDPSSAHRICFRVGKALAESSRRSFLFWFQCWQDLGRVSAKVLTHSPKPDTRISQSTMEHCHGPSGSQIFFSNFHRKNPKKPEPPSFFKAELDHQMIGSAVAISVMKVSMPTAADWSLSTHPLMEPSAL